MLFITIIVIFLSIDDIFVYRIFITWLTMVVFYITVIDHFITVLDILSAVCVADDTVRVGSSIRGTGDVSRRMGRWNDERSSKIWRR